MARLISRGLLFWLSKRVSKSLMLDLAVVSGTLNIPSNFGGGCLCLRVRFEVGVR